MSLSFSAIIAIAISGGAVALIVLGVILFWALGRNRKKYYEEKNGRQLNNCTGENVNPSQLESRTSDISRCGFWKFFGSGKHRQSLSPTTTDEEYDTTRNDSGQPMIQKGHRRWLHSASGATVAHHSDIERAEALESRVGDVCQVEASNHYPSGKEPETNNSNLGSGAVQRQGFHLPGNPRGRRYLVRSRRASNLRCFSDSSVQSFRRPDKGNTRANLKAAVPPLQSGRLRSLSFQSCSSGSVFKKEPPPTPDAIYEACGRLSLSPIQRPDVSGRERDNNTFSGKNLTFDCSGKLETVGDLFPSRAASSARNSEDYHRAEESDRGIPNACRSYRTSPRLLGRSELKSGGKMDSLRVADRSSTLEREKSSSMSLSLQDNWQTPIKGGDSSKDQGWQNEQHRDTGASTSTSDLVHNRRLHSLRTLAAKQLHNFPRGKGDRALRELADGSNRHSRSASSNHTTEDLGSRKHSSDDQDPKHRQTHTQRPLKHKRSSTSRICIHASRPNSVAASAILEDEVLDTSTPRNSPIPPEVEVLPLNFTRPFFRDNQSPSTPTFGPNIDFDNIVHCNTDGSYGNPESNPSVLWSLIGESQSDLSLTGGYPLRASPPPCSDDEETEDVLQLLLDRPESTDSAKIDHNGNAALDQPVQLPMPSCSSNESFEIKPISPLRPRNSAMSPFAPSSTNVNAHTSPHSSLPSSAVHQPGQLALPSSRHSQTSKGPQKTRPTHQLNLQAETTSVNQSQNPPNRGTKDDRAPSPLALLFNSHFRTGTASNMGNSRRPPSSPLPPPPSEPLLIPPAISRSHSRMTSMMMQLRRQNSDGSAYDSSYFKLPQSQHKNSQPNQRASCDADSSANGIGATPRTSSQIPREQEGVLQVERTRSLRSVHSLGRKSRRGRNGNTSDPFVEGIDVRSGDSRSRSSRQTVPSHPLLSNHGPKSNQLVDKSGSQAAEEMIEHAVELGMGSNLPMLAIQDGAHGPSTPGLHSMSDDSEHELSSFGRSIMTEMRREHYEGKRRRSFHQPRSPPSLPRQKPVLQFQQHFPAVPPSPALSLRQNRRQRHQNSSTGSTVLNDASETMTPSASATSKASTGTMDIGSASSKLSRRESQRHRIETLKERVSSMELPSRTKSTITT